MERVTFEMSQSLEVVRPAGTHALLGLIVGLAFDVAVTVGIAQKLSTAEFSGPH